MIDIQLRDYQVEGVAGIRDAFMRKILQVLYVLPTGGGKTYTFSYIAANAAAKGNPVCIIVHRKELLLQASKSLRNLGIDHGMISPHFTPAPHKMVQVASIDTLILRLAKNPEKYKFKLVIFDEAHHVTKTNKWGKVFELLECKTVLGVTATPKRGDGIGLGHLHGGIFREMVLGPTPADLIEWGMLINPIVFTSQEPPDFSGLKKNKDGDLNAEDVAARVDKPKITGSAVEQYTKVCPGVKAIAFCANVTHARHVVEGFNAAGYRFALLVGEPAMSDADRTAVNKALEEGRLDGAATVDLVSEGYDLPDLQCCIMLRRTFSESLFLQQGGRVMRPAPGKKYAYLLDHVGNTGVMKDGAFVPNHGLLNAVRYWSLEGRSKKAKKTDEERTIDLKQCPQCFLVFEPQQFCPGCGHDMGPKKREIEQVEGELHQVTAEMQAKANLKRERNREVGRAKTLEDLEKLAVQRGYKKTWAKHVFNARAK